jgi:hypothetical protein
LNAAFLKARVDRLIDWRPSSRTFVRAWTTCALITIAVAVPTLTISPPVWTDEAHIVEYGRLFFEPHSSWSLFWQGDHGVTPWYFIGAAAQELAERVTSPSCLGTRLFGIAGALFAFAALVAWLRRRNTFPSAALLLGLVFLFEPNFVAAYRGGRVDGWTFACAFSAGYALSTWREIGGEHRLWLAGAAAAIGFFIWPSMAFLFPLLAVELVPLLAAPRARNVFAVTRVGIAALVTAAVLTAIVAWHVPHVPKDVARQLFVAGMSPAIEPVSFVSRVRLLLELLFVRAPWHIALLAYAARLSRSRAPIFLMSLPATIMLSTLLYPNRTMYLVPYLVLFYADAFCEVPRSEAAAPRRGSGGFAILLAAAACAAGVSLGLRSVNAWMHRDIRDESRVFATARAIPYSGEMICIQAMEFYFVGRSLGWRMVVADSDKIPYCETAILSSPVAPVLLKALDENGFRHESTLSTSRMTYRPAFGAGTFGPYELYRRRAVRIAEAVVAPEAQPNRK